MVLKKTSEWVRSNATDIVLALVVFGMAALPRMLDLGLFLTADEKNWIGRSYEFIRAFLDWRFNDMLQTTHPGVTTLWLSGLSIYVKIITDGLPFSFEHLAHFVKASQLPVALLTSLLIPLMYWWLNLVLRNRWMAFLAAAFLALNPFLVGYSRVVHVDALLGSFMLLAVLAATRYAQLGFRQSWLLAASVLCSLALLTKIPAVFLILFFPLVIVLMHGRSVIGWAFWRERVRDGVLAGICIVLLFVIIWPALLWVPNPQGNVLVLKRDISQAAITPHHMAEEYSVNPFFYLGTIASRSSPLILLACAATLLLLVIPFWWGGIRRGVLTDEELRVAASLCVYAVLFVVMMTLGAKKGDRYILPVFFALDILAAIGVVASIRMLARAYFGRVLPVVVSGVIIVLAATIVRYHPYAVAYSNPLLPDNLSQELGWGEGLEQVGAWLNEHAPDAVVASWYPEELAFTTSAQVAHINAHAQSKIRYVVLYRNMFGRAVDHPANDFIDEYYRKRVPVFVAQVAGKEFAWVYEKRVHEQVVGEIVPGVRVAQEIDVTHPALLGIDVLFATYSNRARSGNVLVGVRDSATRETIKTWTIPVSEISDAEWMTFRFDSAQDFVGKKVLVEIGTAGTATGDAPSVRYARTHSYRSSDWQLMPAGAVWQQKSGDLAVRLRYFTDNGEATEEDTRFLAD